VLKNLFAYYLCLLLHLPLKQRFYHHL
jgi:hypothetical protein